MITGFNTDVEHRGTVFHVQTEERGPANPVMVTLVYCGGQVIASMESAYSTRERVDHVKKDAIRGSMQRQHQGLIDAIRRGTYDRSAKPFGSEYLTNRSLDEVVLGYLEQEIPEAAPSRAETVDAAVAELRGDPKPANVQRVLDRLERFLDAAQRAGEAEAVSIPAAMPVVTPVARPAVAPAPALRTEAIRPDDRQRTPRWAWVVTAILLIAGATSLVFFGHRPELTTTAVERPVTRLVQATAPPATEEIETRPPVEKLPEPPVEPPRAAPPQPAVPVISRPEPVPVRSVEPEEGELVPVPRHEPDPVSTNPSPASNLPPADTTAPVESASPVTEGQLIDALDVDILPAPRRRDLPRYTRRAKRAGHEGVVRLRTLIDHHGEVEQVELLQDLVDTNLGVASVEAARSWTFSPAREAGVPVRVWLEFELSFTIKANGITSVRIHE